MNAKFRRTSSWLLVPVAVLITLALVESIFVLNRRSGYPLTRWKAQSGLPARLPDPRVQRLLDAVEVPAHVSALGPSPVESVALDLFETRVLTPGVGPWVPLSIIETTRRSKDGKRVVFRATYSWDSVGRRLTIDPSRGRGKLASLTFLGCSFTFGHGVSDIQTLPSRVAALLPGTRSYNLGTMGGSAATAIGTLNKRELTRGIEPGGIVLLTFIDDHVRRIVGTMRTIGRRSSRGGRSIGSREGARSYWEASKRRLPFEPRSLLGSRRARLWNTSTWTFRPWVKRSCFSFPSLSVKRAVLRARRSVRASCT